MPSLGISTGRYVPSKIQSQKIVNDFAQLLQIAADDKELHRKVDTMIIRLGFGKRCTRCGGSGHHSFYPGVGTVCFKCGGEGEFLPTLNNRLLSKVRKAIDAGALEQFRERERLVKESLDAGAAILAAMRTTRPEGYDHMNVALMPTMCPPDHVAYKVVLDRMMRVYHKYEQLSKPYKEQLRFNNTEALNRILWLRDKAIAKIRAIQEENQLVRN